MMPLDRFKLCGPQLAVGKYRDQFFIRLTKTFHHVLRPGEIQAFRG
jgi:hypothetical protein